MPRSVLRQPLDTSVPSLVDFLVGALLALGLAVGLAVGPAPRASAHAELGTSTPSAGAAVAQLPGSIVLTFSEAVRTPAFVEITAPGGSEVTTGPAHIRERRVSRRLMSSSEPGPYTVAYRVTSADGHAITGTFRFQQQDPGAQGTPTATASPGSPPEVTSSPVSEATEDTEPEAADDGDGPGSGLVLLLLVAVALGLGAVAWAATRALRPSGTREDGGKRPPQP